MMCIARGLIRSEKLVMSNEIRGNRVNRVDKTRVSQSYLPYAPATAISAEMGSLGNLRILVSLGRALSSFIN